MSYWSKRILTLLVLAVVAVAFTGCGGDDNDAKGDGKTLELVYKAPDDSFASWMKDVKKQFESEHEDVTVDITEIQSNEGDYPNKKILMMKSEKTAPDIVMEDSYQIKPDSAAGYLEPITDKVNAWSDWDQFFEPVKDGVTGKGGEIYGVPISTDVRGLWYNKKVFEEAGIDVPWQPATWEEVLDAAEKIKNQVEVPFWLNSGKAMGEGTTMQTFLVLLNGTDSKLYDEEKEKWIVKSDGFLKSLEFIDQIYSNDLGASLSWGITGQGGAKVSTELMPAGEVGIALDGNWVPGNWQENGNAPWPEWSESIDLAPMPTADGQDPGHTTVSGGWTLSIPAKSDNKDLAMEFIKMATSKENLRYGSQLTPRKDIAEMDEYNQLTYQDKMTSFLEFTSYRPSYDNYPAVSSNIQSAVEAVTTDNLTPEEAMKQFAKDVKRDVGEENTKTE
ncbi:extracellular solute-binding protein [Lentibacillus saliphilus]|uniref:extracellular solute-binding protein n=1 Tax=Lentibacillus saliphilus TaxID=2737028 RepID=UPI001FEC5091|nr:extracellular solute-binding protein [Lentibacillus saliphilus]